MIIHACSIAISPPVFSAYACMLAKTNYSSVTKEENMKSENGNPVFCNECPNRGTCVGELSDTIEPVEARSVSKTFYFTLRLRDKVHGRSEELKPLESSWFNGMQEQTAHLEAAGRILRDRVAACTGQNVAGKCVVVDTIGISRAVHEEMYAPQAPVVAPAEPQ